MQFISQRRISECIVEQAVDVSVPQIREPSVEVTKVILQERLQPRTVEQGVRIPFTVQHQGPTVQKVQMTHDDELVRIPVAAEADAHG